MANNTRFNYRNQRRDNNGRFAPSKPKALRRGSLYVAQNKVARYRAHAFGNFVVMSEHNVPFITTKSEIKYATKPQVDAYLSI